MNPADIERAALALVAVHQGAAALPAQDIEPPDRDSAFAVQKATVQRLGPVAAWKVGARAADALPAAAPLPRAGLLADGDAAPAAWTGRPWQLRGVELELGLRLGQDLPADCDPTQLARAIDAVLPVIEVVDTRLADWRSASALAQMADLQSHGALVLGQPVRLAPASLDLRTLEAYLSFDQQPVASTHGGNPAADLWRLLHWLAGHAAVQGMPLRAGDVVTTGSCTGMLFAPEGAQVLGHLSGIGTIRVQF